MLDSSTFLLNSSQLALIIITFIKILVLGEMKDEFDKRSV